MSHTFFEERDFGFFYKGLSRPFDNFNHPRDFKTTTAVPDPGENTRYQHHSEDLLTIGSIGFYLVILTIIIVIIILSWTAYYFCFKKKSIMMQRNRRAKVRPISRRLVRKPTTTPNAPIETPSESPTSLVQISSDKPGEYAQISISPRPVEHISSEAPPPPYKDVTRDLNYVEIGWNIDPR